MTQESLKHASAVARETTNVAAGVRAPPIRPLWSLEPAKAVAVYCRGPPFPAGKRFGEGRDWTGIFGHDGLFRATETGLPDVSCAKVPGS
jgi:hypothetical protein